MLPVTIPQRSWISRASGASAFVVQLAFDTIRWSARRSSLAPSTTVRSAAAEGPEISTRAAPACSPRSATARASARPVHSRTRSIPRRSSPDRSAVRSSGTGVPSITRLPSVNPTDPRQGPKTLSYSNR